MHLTTKHLDDEAERIAKLRGDLLIVPRCGHRFIDHSPRDLRWVGLLLCTAVAVAEVVVLVRFSGVL